MRKVKDLNGFPKEKCHRIRSKRFVCQDALIGEGCSMGLGDRCKYRERNQALKEIGELEIPKPSVEKIEEILKANLHKQEVGGGGMFVYFCARDDRKNIAKAIAGGGDI